MVLQIGFGRSGAVVVELAAVDRQSCRRRRRRLRMQTGVEEGLRPGCLLPWF